MTKIIFDPFLEKSQALGETFEKQTEECKVETRSFQNARKVVEALNEARDHGLEVEFMKTFIDNICIGYSYDESIAHALREWDI